MPKGSSILVVDDDDTVRRTLCALLGWLGHQTTGVASGAEAVSAYATAAEESHPFDVVLLDQNLAGSMTGLQTLHSLRSLNGEVRAILLSGNAVAVLPSELEQEGVVDFLPKPAPLSELRRAVARALEREGCPTVEPPPS